jgi:hypothetical protein
VASHEIFEEKNGCNSDNNNMYVCTSMHAGEMVEAHQMAASARRLEEIDEIMAIEKAQKLAIRDIAGTLITGPKPDTRVWHNRKNCSSRLV